MDYKKIGNFIASERKEKKLTQAKLAEQLFVSEKTISKWENGNGIPDTGVLPKLCEIFQVSINELLNGERISNEKYKENAEAKLIELAKQNEFKNKRILTSAWVLMSGLLLFYLGLVFLVEYTLGESLGAYIIVGVSTVVLVVICFFILKIETDLCCYKCKNCEHEFKPTYNESVWACHTITKRYLKCPKCGKRTWAKRKICK